MEAKIIPDKDLKAGQQYIEIAGQKIPFPEGENITVLDGKFTYMDVINMVSSSLSIEENIEKFLSISIVKDIVSALKILNTRDFFFRVMSFERGAVIVVTFISLLTIIFIHVIFNSSSNSDSDNGSNNKEKEEEEEKKDPPRDFTIDQLREYNGKDDKPIYIALRGDVFDVSSAKDFYGEGSGYHCFAGREASRAMAKLSFEESELSNPDINDLSKFEQNQLEEWYDKFKHYRSYPVIGRVSVPPKNLKLKRLELSEYKGLQEVPAGRVDAPIYVGINSHIFDVSFGGKEFYGEGGPYFCFAGIDASRALAKMSFKEEDLTSTDLSDLTPDQRKTLDDWDKRLSSKYPIVGTII